MSQILPELTLVYQDIYQQTLRKRMVTRKRSDTLGSVFQRAVCKGVIL